MIKAIYIHCTGIQFMQCVQAAVHNEDENVLNHASLSTHKKKAHTNLSLRTEVRVIAAKWTKLHFPPAFSPWLQWPWATSVQFIPTMQYPSYKYQMTFVVICDVRSEK